MSKNLTRLIRTTDVLDNNYNVSYTTHRVLSIGVFKNNNVAPHLDFYATFDDEINGNAFTAVSENGDIPPFVYADSQKIAITGSLLESFKRQPIRDPR